MKQQSIEELRTRVAEVADEGAQKQAEIVVTKYGILTMSIR